MYQEYFVKELATDEEDDIFQDYGDHLWEEEQVTQETDYSEEFDLYEGGFV